MNEKRNPGSLSFADYGLFVAQSQAGVALNHANPRES